MLDQFWRRWIREYLPTIARRTKWLEETKPLEVGDLVIVVEEKVRNGWIRGRVVGASPGRDGRVRDAVVQTAEGFLRRPVAKLARLDLEGCKPEPEVPDQLNGSGRNTCRRRIPPARLAILTLSRALVQLFDDCVDGWFEGS